MKKKEIRVKVFTVNKYRIEGTIYVPDTIAHPRLSEMLSFAERKNTGIVTLGKAVVFGADNKILFSHNRLGINKMAIEFFTTMDSEAEKEEEALVWEIE